jgi:hypothetical protein
MSKQAGKQARLGRGGSSRRFAYEGEKRQATYKEVSKESLDDACPSSHFIPQMGPVVLKRRKTSLF